jgi:N-hydroxyarylamine O-acetyltransferase
VEVHLNNALVDRVLGRLGIAAPPPTRAGLETLYRAWCASVPWDNVQKRITIAERRAVLGGAYPNEFFENFLRHGTGGTCWPSSGALHAILVYLGFPARRGLAAMGYDRWGRVVNHGTAIVRLDGEDLIVDSSIRHAVPLPLRDGARIDDPAHRARVDRTDGEWVIRWTVHSRDEELACLLLDDDVAFDRYLERYESSRVSGFSYLLTFSKGVDGGVLSVNGLQRVFRASDGSLSAGTVSDRGRLLVAEGGLSEDVVARLPPDEPDPNRPAPVAT